MRNPIQDANEGAAMQVAPTKKHAIRTATVAKQNNNQALQKQQQINQISSQLGNALGNFMEGKRATEMEQRYSAAYHEQGTKEGLSEFQKDMKKTGFTEFMYGGQTPEYLGALNASARNAANAMYLEEAEFIEGEGGDYPPDAYRTRMQEKLTEYNLENFADAPDAAFAFMSNWKDSSNELSKQQVKLYKVRQQEEARRTVAEGFQTDFDVYKTMIKTNPDKAEQIGKDMFTGAYKPVGMSDIAFRDVVVKESLTAIRAHDYSALKLLNDSGIVNSFNDSELKEYDTVRTIIDTDTFNATESARLAYETAIEAPTHKDVSRARQQYESTIAQARARDTGSSKHIKDMYGSDRHLGALGKQYRERLIKEEKERVDTAVGDETFETRFFDAELASADAKSRREMVAKRLDNITLALSDPILDIEVRADLADQITKYTKKLEGWESDEANRLRKGMSAEQKAIQAELDLREGVESLMSGGGYTLSDTKSKKAQLSGAVNNIANQLIPDTEMKSVDKLEAIVSNPLSMKNFMVAAGKFGSALGDSPEIKTAISNLAMQMKAPNESNIYTPDQKLATDSLNVLKLQNPQLYNAAFPTRQDRLEVRAISIAMSRGKGITETNNLISKIEQNIDLTPATPLSNEDVITRLGLSAAPANIQDEALQEYKYLLPLGKDNAMVGAMDYMSNTNPILNGTRVMYGGGFEKIDDTGLEDIMKTLSKTYRSGDTSKSGFTEPLQRLLKNSTTKQGAALYRLDQVPGLQVSVYQGNLVLELNGGRRQVISRDAMEIELDGYKQRARARPAKPGKFLFWDK